ncbi:MAG: GIY-YIG nuclease family protein [Candidatus Sulfotelmatobacter sp.]
MIYFAQHRTGEPIKIGFASDAKSRFRTLQIANWKTLKCLALIKGTQEDERQLHERFKGIHHRGEWFKPARELRDYIKSLTSVDAISSIRPTGRGLKKIRLEPKTKFSHIKFDTNPLRRPAVKVFVRHKATCPSVVHGEFYQGCSCPKYLRYSHGTKQYRHAAKTRSWNDAEKERAELQNHLDSYS